MKDSETKKKVYQAFREMAEKHAMFAGSRGVLVALSGGADSVALLLLLCEYQRKIQNQEQPHASSVLSAEKSPCGMGNCEKESAAWAASTKFCVYAAHINHKIRGMEAERDRDFCIALCERLGVHLFVVEKDVPAYAAEHKLGLEEAARLLRYRALEDLLTELPCVDRLATAHHAGDNLETVLFHLARGTGITGLCGIPPVRGSIVRPLLGCSKADLMAYCRASGESWVTDTTNECDDYTRNQIRHHVVPALEALGTDPERAVFRMTETLRKDRDFLEREVDQIWNAFYGKATIHGDAIHGNAIHGDAIHGENLHGNAIHGDAGGKFPMEDISQERTFDEPSLVREPHAMVFLPRSVWCGLDSAIVGRLLSRMYRASGAEIPLETIHYEATRKRIAEEKGSVSLPEDRILTVDREGVYLGKMQMFLPLEREPILLAEKSEGGYGSGFREENGIAVWWGAHRSVETIKKTWITKNIYKLFIHMKLNSATMNGRLYFRGRMDGDTIAVGGHRKKLKKLFAERGVGTVRAARLPIFCDDDGIVCIPGVAMRDSVQAGGSSGEGDHLEILVALCD